VAAQFHPASARSRPEKHGTERPLQNLPALLMLGFVKAARFLGGQVLFHPELN
jgi:hypothetical protein